MLNIAFDLATEIDACRDIAAMRRILAEIAGQAGADAVVLRERLAGSDETMTAHVVAELGARRWFEADLATSFLTVTPLRAYMLRERRPLDLDTLRRLCAAAGVTEVMEGVPRSRAHRRLRDHAAARRRQDGGLPLGRLRNGTARTRRAAADNADRARDARGGSRACAKARRHRRRTA